MDATPSVHSPMFPVIARKMCGDMKFVAVFTIIYGAITCIGIITAAIGIPMIIAGIRLNEAANSFLTYLGGNNAQMLESAFERQGRYFFIVKVLIIIGLVALALYLIIVVVALIATTSRHYY